MNRCDQEKRVTPFLLGDLSEREEAEFSRHLESCTACQNCSRELSPVLKTLANGLARDDATAPRFDLHHQLTLLSVPAENPHRVIEWMSRARPWLVAAACAMVVTGLSYFVIFSSMSHQYGWSSDSLMPLKHHNKKFAAAIFTSPELSIEGYANNDFLMGSGKQEADTDGPSLNNALEKDNRAKDLTDEDRFYNYSLKTWDEPAVFSGSSGSVITEVPLDEGMTIERELGANYPKLEQKARIVQSTASRLNLNGVYAGRTAAGREEALRKYGGQPETSEGAYAETQVSEHTTGKASRHKHTNGQLEWGLAKKPAATSDALTYTGETDIPRSSGRITSGTVLAEKVSPPQKELAAPRPPRAKTVTFHPFVATTANRFSTFALDVNTASYNLTRQALRSGALPEPEVVRTEEILNSFDYGDAAPDRATFRVYIEGAPSPCGAAGLTLLRIGVKGKRLGREEQRPAMLTFLVDTSGSMAQPNRLGRARMALQLLVNQLAATDKIQIISFDDKARLVLPPTPATQKQAILQAFDRLQCSGSTNLEEGMHRAYQQAARAFAPGSENRVILISDGVANLGADNAQEILREIEAFRKQGVTCSVFGVGDGSYNDVLLEELANKGQGVYRFLDSDEEVKRVFVDDLSATINHIAADVKIQVEWSSEAVRRFRQLGYEQRALQAEQFRDNNVEAGEVGSGQSVTALYELDLAPEATRASLGMVRVRYKRVDTGATEEISQEITPEMIAPSLRATRPQFRLAAGAAAFAELLRGSPYVVRTHAEVANLLRPVTQELSLDPRVKELLAMVETAAALKK